MAPEIYQGKYDGKKVDIFALGVILFIMKFGLFPFKEALKTNDFYKLIHNRNYKGFWRIFQKVICNTSEEFKDLFLRMVASNPY